MSAIRNVFFAGALFFTSAAAAQQVADTNYHPPRIAPRYPAGTGPQIWIDEAHHNFHTADGRYRPFAQLMEADGYRTERYTDGFSGPSLAGKKIIVIANALHHTNVDDWNPPNYSAFSEAEIAALRAWVQEGGSLFLIADHMPFAGAARDLAAAFGFTCYNGFLLDSVTRGRGADLFTRQNGRFTPSGFAGLDAIDTVATFTGQAFDIPEGARSLLTPSPDMAILLPKEPWEFSRSTPRMPAAGKSQGAVLAVGKGRVVMWGEAAMFTAQTAGGVAAAGMNTPAGKDNYLLLLSLVHWLDDAEK